MPRFSEDEGAPAGVDDFFVFASPAAVAASSEPDAVNGSLASVGVVQNVYRLDLFPSAVTLAANDAVNIIAPVAPAGAVWTRLGGVLQSAAVTTDWFIDSGVSGNDGAAGTALAPLKTLAELERRLRGVVLQVGVRVHLAAGAYGVVDFDIEFAAIDGLFFIVQGAVSSSAPVVLVTSTPTNGPTNQRGLITAATTFVVGTRLRLTATATPAFTGAMTDVTLVPGAGQANVAEWAQISNEVFGTTVNEALPVAGDSFVVDTLQSTIAGIRIRGDGALRTRVMVRDCVNTAVTGGADQFYGQATTLVTGAGVYACQYSGQCYLQECFGFFFCNQTQGCVIDAGHVNVGALVVRGNLVIQDAHVLQRGQVQCVGGGYQLSVGAQWSSNAFPWSVVDATGTGVLLANGSFVQATSAVLWGANNTLAIGINVGMGSCFGYLTTAPVLAATTQVELNGVGQTYATNGMNATNGAVYGVLA